MIRKKLGLICGASAFLILILDSRAAAQAAAEGVQVCLRTVIPCLFPFFLLSGYLTGNLEGGKSIAKLFHCPENCGSVLLTGLLGGYPVGAKQAAEAWRMGIITKAQADRLLRFCSQAGPSFLFGIVSAQVGGVREGWILWGIQVLSALSVAWLLPMEPDHYTPRNRAERKNNNLMTSALSAMASVCGWVILFSVVISFARRWFLWLLPDNLQILLCGLLELTSGFDGDLTVEENVFLRGSMLGYTRKFLNEIYAQIIKFAELEDFQKTPFRQLSSGMKSRLAFSIASFVRPDILILDEVLAVGDGAFRSKSEARMKQIIHGGATTILVSHDLGQIQQLCNKILWLHKGQQVEFGSDVQEICDRYEAFLREAP
jgi:hypothetical protein